MGLAGDSHNAPNPGTLSNSPLPSTSPVVGDDDRLEAEVSKFQEGVGSPSLLLADMLGVDKQRVVNTKQYVAAVRSTPKW